MILIFDVQYHQKEIQNKDKLYLKMKKMLSYICRLPRLTRNTTRKEIDKEKSMIQCPMGPKTLGKLAQDRYTLAYIIKVLVW